MSESIKLCAIGIAFAIICVLIKQYRTEFLVPTRLAAIILIAGMIIILVAPVLEFLKNLMEQALHYDYLEIIVKSLAIAYITHISSELCRDCGENGIATGIETVGKIEIIILSLPLINKMISMSEELISW